MEDTDQHRDKRARIDSSGPEELERMEVESARHATNHDRNDEMDIDSKDAEADSLKAVALAGDEKTLENLQKDMGDAFLLCRSSKTLSPSTTYTFSLQVC
jgi:hypothetical protein